MPHLQRTEHSRYSAEQLFALVADVPSYPQFLPWCKAARITRQLNEYEFHAELVIAFKAFTEKYTSHVTLIPASESNAEHTVLAEMLEGPFQHLRNEWRFTSIESGGTDIHLDLDFQFKSKILDGLIGGVFSNASEKMISAFRARARALYGEPA